MHIMKNIQHELNADQKLQKKRLVNLKDSHRIIQIMLSNGIIQSETHKEKKD